MKLLRKLTCWLLGHAPITECRGMDSVLACERCHCLFGIFVKDLYVKKELRHSPLHEDPQNVLRN
jgi:hypothetical protein